MKAYTDIEQSKKLAEILPLESADMFLAMNGTLPVMSKYIDNGLVTADETAIPCWGLAALLDVIPKEVKIKGQRYAPVLFPITDGHWLYKLWYNSNEIIEAPVVVWCDNPIDACYEIILKLHELKML